jgi:hypothetical protein
LLTRKGTEALVRVERLLDDASRAMPARGIAAGTLGALDGERRAGTQTAAGEQASIPRGD